MKYIILLLVFLSAGCSTNSYKEKYTLENGEQYMITVRPKIDMDKENFLKYSKYLADIKKEELASSM